MLKIKRVLILIVILISLILFISPSRAGECPVDAEGAIQLGSGDDAICIYCNDADGGCLDEVTDNYCIKNGFYDPDCNYYDKEKETGRSKNINGEGVTLNYDWCNDDIDNDKDTYKDFQDGDCDTEGLSGITYFPDPVPEGSSFTLNCHFTPTVNGVPITFGSSKPYVYAYNGYGGSAASCTFNSWSGNTISFTCPSSGIAICGTTQNEPYDSDTIEANINLALKSCDEKGGVLNCQTGYYCTNQVEASDGLCCLTCSPDLSDNDGDGAPNYQDIAINDPCSKLASNDNCGGSNCNTDADSDNLYTNSQNTPLTGANCDSMPYDKDNDDYIGTTWNGNDCNDNNVNINPAATEHCSDGVDNNCNSLTDQQDPKCVTITSISAPARATQSVNFELSCTSTIDSNCVGANIDSGTCTFNRWESTTAVFSCSTSGTGIINLECYISNKPDGSCTIAGHTATPSASSRTTTIDILTSVCSARSQADCSLDNICEFCIPCSPSNPKFSSGLSSPGSCVEKDTCLERYQCRKDSCGATCDPDSWVNCLGYQICDESSTCLCQDKPCTSNELGQSSTHSETPDVYICAGTTASSSWILESEVLSEDQYSCSDNKDNDGDALTDCNDPDCDGLTNSAGLTCCTTSLQTICDTLEQECTNFNACTNDYTKRGEQLTFTCTSNICQQNPGTPCDVSCNTECCIPGHQDCKSFGTLSDVDSDGKTEICTTTEGNGNWFGANCNLGGCSSTDNIDYECLTPDDCPALNPGTCGNKVCDNSEGEFPFQCRTEIAPNQVEKCQDYIDSQNYECAELDPLNTCTESSPGVFNCIFTGASELCSNTYSSRAPSNDGFDLACNEEFLCNTNICQDPDVVSDPCCLCHSQCVSTVSDPSKAPYELIECEVAENAQWVDSDCPQGG